MEMVFREKDYGLEFWNLDGYGSLKYRFNYF